jgi:AcrR family transcriptional regulator
LARLTREESRALTRAKLLASAREVIGRDGYDVASVDRIAEEAGFSKGAFYSNFNSKEEIVLELLETHSLHDVEEIAGLIGETRDPLTMIEVVSEWSRKRSAEPGYGIVALELFRRASRDKTFSTRHANLFRAQWRGLGKLLLSMFPEGAAPASAETLGGLVFELTYGGASRYQNGPSAGDMVRVALTGLYDAYGKRAPRRAAAKVPAPVSRKSAARGKQKVAA